MRDTTFVVLEKGADLSELRAIHHKHFPGNDLALWENENGVVVKVSHSGEVDGGMELEDALAAIGWKYSKEIP